MVEHLRDLKTRNIYTKPTQGLGGPFFLGDRIFEILRDLKLEGKIRGAYFSHYSMPPQVPPHVKVGIRYEKLDDFNWVDSLLDSLCVGNAEIVTDKGRFEAPTGELQDLPTDIVVDYVICNSFEFLLKVREKLGNELPKVNDMTNFIVQRKQEITDRFIMGNEIFRDGYVARPLTDAETGKVWERFVHHLVNASKATYDPNNPAESYEAKVKFALLKNGIPIQLSARPSNIFL